MSKVNAPTAPTYPYVTWSGSHIYVEEGMVGEKETSYAGTPFGNFAQAQTAHQRSIQPAPGSLYGDAEGKSMVMSTGTTVLPNLPPAQEVYERPQWYPGVGWVTSATTQKA
jgi:hypothetical protein